MNDKNIISHLIKEVRCLKSKISEQGGGGEDSDWLKQSDSSVPTDINDNITTNGKVGVNTSDEEFTFDVQQEAPVLETLTGTFSFDPNTFIITGVGSQILTEFDFNSQYLMPDGNTYQGFDFSPISDTEMFFFPFPTPPAFNGEEISKSVVNSKIAKIGDQFEVSDDTVKITANMTQIDEFPSFNREGRNISNSNNITDTTGTKSTLWRHLGNRVSSFFRRNTSPITAWGIELFSASNARRVRFDEFGNLFYINAPDVTGNSSYSKQLVARTDGTIAFEDKGGGAASLDKRAFKQNATGYYEIDIAPFFQGTIIMTVKILKHNQGVEEYTITGYTNGSTWFAPRVTKISQTGNEETVRFVNNGSGDFKIYIGDGTASRGLSNLFITEVLRAGILTTNPSIQTDISGFGLSVTPTITGTVQATI